MARTQRRESNLPTVQALSSKLSNEQMTEISKRAMLVSLSIGVWDPNITDKSASAEVSEQKGVTEQGACRVRKTRLPRNPYTKRINDLISELRTYHYGATLLWTKEGTRILPVASFQEYTTRVNLAKQQLHHHVQALVDNYEDLKAEGKKMLGSLYSEGDYPSAATLASRYSITPQFTPLPNSGQFLDLGFSTEQEKALRQQLEDGMRDTLAGATTRIWHDLYEKLKTLSERVGNPDSRLHEQVITGVIEMAEMLPRLNLLEDPGLNQMADTLKSTLAGMTMSKLKADEDLRRSVHTKTAQAVARMEALMFPGMGASQLM